MDTLSIFIISIIQLFILIYITKQHNKLLFVRFPFFSVFLFSLLHIEFYWITLAPKVEIGPDGQQRYICRKCGVKYKFLSQLKTHAKECGKGATCPICGFTCTQRRNLPAHMATHANSTLVKRRRMPKRKKYF